MKKKIAFCNGKFIEEEKPCISINDRGFLYGDGVFTTIKVVDGVPEFFDAHLTRLKEQCESLKIDPPIFSLDDVNRLILKNQALKGTWRLKIIITGGNHSSLCLDRRPFGKHLMSLKQVFENDVKELKLTVFPTPISGPSSKLKTLSYLNRLFVIDYANSHGYDDALVLSKEGFIMETAFSNLFWVLGRDLFVPDPDLDLMMGITLLHQIERYQKLDYRIHFVKEKLKNVPLQAEYYVCNAIKGVLKAKIDLIKD